MPVEWKTDFTVEAGSGWRRCYVVLQSVEHIGLVRAVVGGNGVGMWEDRGS